MNNASNPTPSKGRRGWLRVLLWLAGVLVALLVVVYFVATSSAFVKGFILPKVSAAMNADISLADAEISPFSKVVFHDLKVTPKGQPTLFSAAEIRARYSLWSIIGGRIAVDEVAIVSPTITLVQNADGTSNLDPLLKKAAGKPAPTEKAAAPPGKPPMLDVKSVTIDNATIRRVVKLNEGGQDTMELANVNFSVANIQNGQSGKLDLSASVAMENAARKNSPAASLAAKIAGDFTFALTPDLKPASVKGDTSLTVDKATGALADVAGLIAKIDCDLTSTDIKQVALRFSKADATLAELRVSGPFDISKTEGKLKVELTSLDHKLLNLVGAAGGIDFGTTTINSTNDIQLDQGGKAIALAGRLDIANLQVTRQGQTTPTLNLNCAYNVLVNSAAQSASIKALDLVGTQNQQPLLRADLTSPMTIAWGNANSEVGDATLNLAVTDLNLADWKSFAAGVSPSGVANVKLKVESQKGGKQLTLELNSGVDKLAARFGSNEINQTDVRLTAHAGVADLKQFKLDNYRLEVSQQGQSAAVVSGSGTFDSAKMEGGLKVELTSLDRKLLNLAGAAGGIDFGTTTINSTNDIQLDQGGKAIALAGRLVIANLQVTRQGQTTPTLNLNCAYNVLVNSAAQSASIKALDLVGTQNQQPLLRADLTSPMTIAWGNANSEVGDATLNLAVTDLNLADWKSFAAGVSPSGVANVKLKVESQKGGKQLTLDLDSGVDKLAARFGSNEISQTDIRLTAHAGVADLKQFKLDSYRLEVSQQGQSAAVVSGSATFDSATQNADAQVAIQATLARLLAMVPQPGANISAGTLDFKSHVTRQDKNQTVSGQLALTDLTGKFGANRFASFGVSADYDVSMKGNVIEIQKMAGQLQAAQKPGGSFTANGNFDLEHKAGQISVQLTDCNQEGLRPFLEVALGDKKLVSVALNTTASANLAANGDASVKTDVHLANLVVSDPTGALPATPLEARVQVDASVAKQVAQVRQCELTLTPTYRAKNDLNLTGNVDFSKTNAITGSLKLAAESLDVTRYFDLFAGKAQTTTVGTSPAQTTTSQPAASPAANPNQEPDAVKLPLQNFTFEANIGQFYLRQVAISNLLTTAKIDGGHIVIKPCQLTLNGAPVNANVDLDLGVPGYKYDVAFNANAIPLTPLVDSFAPDRKGQIGGTTTVSAQIKGAGTTGPNLKQNLSGKFSYLSTNLNLSIADVRSPLINGVLNVIIGIPDLIRNPTAVVGSLFSRSSGTAGWADQLTAAPIEVILANGDIGEGRVHVQQAEVRSSAFEAGVTGDLAFAPILTNSTIQFPVSVSLSRPLGQRIGLVSANTPADAVYVPMPQFLTMTGTLGKPDHHIDAAALAVLAAKATSGLVQGIGGAAGGKVGGLLQGVGGLFGGNSAPATTQDTNAQPSTAQPQNPVNELLNLFKKPKH